MDHVDSAPRGPGSVTSRGWSPGRWFDLASVSVLLLGAYLVRRAALPFDGLVFDDAWVVAGATKADPGQLLTVSTNHPGFTAALMGWTRIVSDRSELFAWLPFAFGVAAPAAVYLVAVRALAIARPVAAAAGLLLVVAPEHALFSGRVKPYVIGTVVTIGLAALVPASTRRRWTWPVAVGWVLGALLVGSIEALTLVVTAVAAIVVVTHPSGDRALRLGAVAVQAVLQAVLLRTVQGRFASNTVASEWETTYDGYVELDRGPWSVVEQGWTHAGRLGQNIVPGHQLLGLAVVALAVSGLGWRARRGEQRIAARFLLGLVLVSALGGLVRQIPFGPAVGNPTFPGGRANLWFLPAVLIGLAWTVDGLIRAVGRRQRTAAMAASAAALAGALLVVGIHADDARTYPLPGAASAARSLRALDDGRTLIVVLPGGTMPLAAEPGIPARPVADRDGHQGFLIAWDAPGWHDVSLARQRTRFEAELAGRDRVVFHNGFAGYGDGSLPPLRALLGERGFEETSADPYGVVVIEVWERAPVEPAP